PVGGDAERAARACIGVERLWVGQRGVPVIAARNPDEYTGRGTGEFLSTSSSVLDRFPDDLKEQALLRVHPHRLARRNAEEGGIETIDLFEEAAAARNHFAPRGGVRAEIGRQVPPLWRDVARPVDAVVQQRPE